MALGAPLGLSGSVTSGIVSAIGRDIPAPTGDGGTTVLIGSIQTDASINPGNSGGPLVDCQSRIVGIKAAISTVPNAQGVGGGGSVGIGFAVPSETVQYITGQLLDNGRAAHPWLGMSTAPVPAEVAATFGTQAGLYVPSCRRRTRCCCRHPGRGRHHPDQRLTGRAAGPPTCWSPPRSATRSPWSTSATAPSTPPRPPWPSSPSGYAPPIRPSSSNRAQVRDTEHTVHPVRGVTILSCIETWPEAQARGRPPYAPPSRRHREVWRARVPAVRSGP